jgi:hypothetical protein
MISYLIYQTPNNYSGMLLITWLNLLQYMRFSTFFRFFIDLIIGVTFDPETLKFLIVWAIGVAAFSTSSIILHSQDSNIQGQIHNFAGEFKDYAFISFGDFGAADKL